MNPRTIQKRFVFLIIGGMCTLVFIAIVNAKGFIPPRALAIVLLAYCALFFIALKWFVFPRKPSEISADTVATVQAHNNRRKASIKNLKIMVAVLVLLLLNGLRYVGIFPLWALGIAIAINLCLTATLIRIIVRLQKLNQL